MVCTSLYSNWRSYLWDIVVELIWLYAPIVQEDIVLCKIYRKATSLKELEQRATMGEDMRASQVCMSMMDNASSDDQENYQSSTMPLDNGDPREVKEETQKEVEVTSISIRQVNIPELQVPKHSFDWMQDPFSTQLRSPWLDPWLPNF